MHNWWERWAGLWGWHKCKRLALRRAPRPASCLLPSSRWPCYEAHQLASIPFHQAKGEKHKTYEWVGGWAMKWELKKPCLIAGIQTHQLSQGVAYNTGRPTAQAQHQPHVQRWSLPILAHAVKKKKQTGGWTLQHVPLMRVMSWKHDELND